MALRTLVILLERLVSLSASCWSTSADLFSFLIMIKRLRCKSRSRQIYYFFIKLCIMEINATYFSLDTFSLDSALIGAKVASWALANMWITLWLPTD